MEENPQFSIVEERDELMVSPNGGNPFLRKAHFLKPTFPSFMNEPLSKLPDCFSSASSHLAPRNVEFSGWTNGPEDWKTWVQHLAPVHQSTWKKTGIYEAIVNSTQRIKKLANLIYGFAERWCSETNTFIFPWGEATITLEDVMVLGGFSVLGDSVSSPLEGTELKEVEDKLHDVRKEIQRGPRKAASTCLWFKKFMKSGHEFEHEAFLVYWLSRCVLPKGRIINKPVFSIAIHLARGSRIALAPAVLASIYRDLDLLKRKIIASNQLGTGDDALGAIVVQSPFHLVQVWAWERFSRLRPKPRAINYGEPRMARWDKVQVLKVENLRAVLDSSAGNFEWRPYAMAIENWDLPKHYPHKEKWVTVGPDWDDELLSFVRCLRVSELVGIGTIQQYLPHRVAKQFGFDQDLPCSVTLRDHNSGIAGKHYTWKVKNIRLYLPSGGFMGDVSSRYLKWWKKSMSDRKYPSEASVSQKQKEERMNWSVIKSNYPLVPPGFPPKHSDMEAGDPMDVDQLTISEFLKLSKKTEDFEISKANDSGRLSGQFQYVASPIAEESSNNTMKSGKDKEGIHGNERPSSSTLFEKRFSELTAWIKMMECEVGELKKALL